jgi:hypothetical protein
MVPMTVPGRGRDDDNGEGRANGAVPGRSGEGGVDGAVPGRFDVEENRDTDVEAHTEDVVEGARWRQTRRRSRHRRVCDREMTELGFRGSGTFKKKNCTDVRG